MHFLTFMGYCWSFRWNFSTVVVPITDLLKGKGKFILTPVCQSSFEWLNAFLCSAPALAALGSDRPFKQYMNASGVGAGSILKQAEDSSIERLVSFFSKKLTLCQKNDSVIENGTTGAR